MQNIQTIYNYEIIKRLRFTFNITDILTAQRDQIYKTTKEKFEVVFTQNPSFKYFFDTKPEHWKSYLWWFFNVGIEIEKKKALDKPVVAPCETENAELTECLKRNAECEKRNTECKDKLARLTVEIEQLKRPNKDELERIQQLLYRNEVLDENTQKTIKDINSHLDNIEKQRSQTNDDLTKQYLAQIQQLKDEKQHHLSEQAKIQEEKKIIMEKLQKCESADLNFRMVTKNHMDELLDMEKQLQRMEKKEQEGTKQIVRMSNELTELTTKNTKLLQEIESRQERLSEIEDVIRNKDSKSSVESTHKNSVSMQTSPIRQTDASVQMSPIRQTDASVQTSPIENLEITKLEKEKQDLEKEKRELLAENTRQTKEIKENTEKIEKQRHDIHTTVLEHEDKYREFNKKTAELESKITQLKNEKTQQLAQEQRDQEKKTQEYKTLYDKQVKVTEELKQETEQLKQQLSETSTPPPRPTEPFLPTRTTNTLPRLYINPIVEFLEKCIKESYSIDRIIRIADVKREIRPLFEYQEIRPRQLIDHLNTTNAADELNHLLYVAITHKSTSIQKKYYVGHIASLCNINPKIQHTARGLTVLDIAISSGDVDNAYALLKNPLFDINNQYATGALRHPYSRPIIEAIKHRNTPIIMLLLKNPKCNIHLKDSAGRSPLDYVFAIDGSNSREYRNLLFGLLVHSNKARELREESIFKHGDIMDKLDVTMFHTLQKEDKPLFEKLYREHYKNNAKMMAKLPRFLLGGRRRRGTKRRGRSVGGGRKTKCGGQTGVLKGGSTRKPRTRRGRGRGRSGVKHSKTKRRSIA